MIRRTSRWQLSALFFLLLLGLVAPLPYVLVEPGTPTNLFATVKKKEVLEIVGKQSYPTSGALNLTSIWVTSPESRLQSFELIQAWIDGERAVQPREVFYPRGIDPKKVNQENVAEMKVSQQSAQLAALNYLDIKYSTVLLVKGFSEGSPNSQIVRIGDQIMTFQNQEVKSSADLRKRVQESTSDQLKLGVLRDGKRLSLPITKNGNILGLLIADEYRLPFSVKIRLKDIGGPSAGLIFALAIIDKLSKEDLVQERNIAGTGTITPSGEVGPIGGIEEKLIGAAREGATLFLAPSLNCPEIRHIPRGLRVVPVDTLAEAVSALRERDTERLPICG